MVGKKRRQRPVISKHYLKPRWSFLSQDRRGTLLIEGHSVKQLAEKYGTPVYVLVESEIRNRLRRVKNAFPYSKFRPQYACKCNSNLEIMRIAREEGFELDASSVGEIILGLLADFQPSQITFTNLYKTENDINFAAQVGILSITVDSLEEINRVARVGAKLRKKIQIFLRFNPMIAVGRYSCTYKKYGVPIKDYKKAISLIAGYSDNIELIGLHFHGGFSGNPKTYFLAAKRLVKIARYCAEQHNINIEFIDLGGGFVPYSTGTEPYSPEDYGKKFVKYFQKIVAKNSLPLPTLIFEPGKFIVSSSCIGLTKVVSRKNISKKKQIVVVDGSTYSFVPDVLTAKAYYDILPATKMRQRRTHVYDIAGCTCDCIDILGFRRKLPRMAENDLLAIMDCGAYSNVIASNFNTLRRAPMVMIKESGAIKLIRRRDRYSEMFAPELDVLKVADPKELKNLYDMYRINIDKLWTGSKKKKRK